LCEQAREFRLSPASAPSKRWQVAVTKPRCIHGTLHESGVFNLRAGAWSVRADPGSRSGTRRRARRPSRGAEAAARPKPSSHTGRAHGAGCEGGPWKQKRHSSSRSSSVSFFRGGGAHRPSALSAARAFSAPMESAMVASQRPLSQLPPDHRDCVREALGGWSELGAG
jgi:hypothetical protein